MTVIYVLLRGQILDTTENSYYFTTSTTRLAKKLIDCLILCLWVDQDV